MLKINKIVTFYNKLSTAFGRSLFVCGTTFIFPSILGENLGDLEDHTFISERDLEICSAGDFCTLLKPLYAGLWFT